MDVPEKKNYNLIPDRINNINKLLENTQVDSIINSSPIKDDNKQNTDDIRYALSKKNYDFGKVIAQLGGKLLYIKSGSTGHTFKGIYPPLENGEPNPRKSYAVKIVAYPKKENYGDMYSVMRPENAELMMIKLLSNFVIDKQTPHIVLPITTFNTSIKPFLSLSKNNIIDNKKFDQFLDKYKKNEYYQNVSVLISEWASEGDLLDYIRKHYKSFKIRHWRTIFFQFLSVLAVIQAKYPDFRHNDLKANNLLVDTLDMSRTKYKYTINGTSYTVPNIGFQIKLWDFDFACIPDIVRNSKVEADWTSKINIKPEQNRYYDVHYFFNTFTRKGFFPEFWTEPEIPDKVREFVRRVVPEKFASGKNVTEKGRILINDEYMIPDNIIKEDSFFKVMRESSYNKDS
jgi:hypothetical protein